MNFTKKIKLKLKDIYDSLASRNDFKKNILNAFPFWIGAVITGLISVIYAKLFSFAELGTQYIFHLSKWLFFIVTPLSFLSAWFLVIKFAPFSRGSGIPQVSAAIELTNPRNNHKVSKLLSIRVAFIKIMSSLLMIFGGGIIGREGPTIQISASIFKKINEWLPHWYPKISKQNMIVTGAAAGLASAFNTPLGGIVFAIEELTKTHFNYFKSALLTGVIIAGLTALNILGPYLYLGYPQLNDISSWIVLMVIPVSIITGLLGSSMGKIILFIISKKSILKSTFQKASYILICALIIASFAVIFGKETLGSGKELMVNALFTNNKHLEWYIPLCRIFGTIISFSTGAAGGIFAPSLSAGACFGAVFSGWMHLSYNATNLIVLCGMVGFLTGITRSPFTSFILVMEMTNNHGIIFHLMFAALLANLFAAIITKRSFYDHLKDKFIDEVNIN